MLNKNKKLLTRKPIEFSFFFSEPKFIIIQQITFSKTEIIEQRQIIN